MGLARTPAAAATAALAAFFCVCLVAAGVAPELRVESGVAHTVGESVEVKITLSEAPSGLSGYNITVYLKNGSVAEIASVELPDWASLHSNSSLPGDSVWIKAVDLEDEVRGGAVNVTLATLTLVAEGFGTTEVAATVTRMDDDRGDPIEPAVVPGSFDPPAQTEQPVLSFEPPTLEIRVGSAADVTLVADSLPEGLSGYNVTVSLSDGEVAEIVGVSFPDWAVLHSNSSLPSDSVWMKAVDLNDKVVENAENVTLATLKIRGEKAGECSIVITVTKMDDDGGDPIEPVVTAGSVEVFAPAPTPTPSVNISTDKFEYRGGEPMLLNITLANPGEAAGVRFVLGVTLTLRIFGFELGTFNRTLLSRTLTLPSGFERTFPLRFITPRLPPFAEIEGTWHATLHDPKTHELICEDYVSWEIVGSYRF